ncbi:hypothetical protein JQN72_03220 [Phycicoccus sp. CSK15P-2]|uniref:hypothetical protein n=1 Tax=Phycicoccus sp. CSK15P-2 TaxID=2807627 RepID=UPI001950CE83|nr:hypothetical protein [Phycicoccus sp. CSK15P-2]MBM6403256.1 hypothetical protein [Phycicoccus sp. CSK15P-2]
MISGEDEQYLEVRAREAALQEILDDLVRTPRDWTVDGAAEELRGRIEARGLPPRAPSWVTAAAEGIGRGEAYVVSAETKREEDVPPPPRHLENKVVD